MDKLNFTLPTKKVESWYSIVESISQRLGEPMGKWMNRLSGWSINDILKQIRSAESLAKDADIPFPKAWNSLWKKIEWTKQ